MVSLRLGKQVEGEVKQTARSESSGSRRDRDAFPRRLCLLRIKAGSELAQSLSSLKTNPTALCMCH